MRLDMKWIRILLPSQDCRVLFIIVVQLGKQKIKHLTEKQGESINIGLHTELLSIMHEKTDEIEKAYPKVLEGC